MLTDLPPVAGDVENGCTPSKAEIVELATRARRSGVLPEQFLATFKAHVYDAPGFRMKRARERGDMMQRLVSIAIEAYFTQADDRSGGENENFRDSIRAVARRGADPEPSRGR